MNSELTLDTKSERWNRTCVRTIDQMHLLSSRELSAPSGSEKRAVSFARSVPTLVQDSEWVRKLRSSRRSTRGIEGVGGVREHCARREESENRGTGTPADQKSWLRAWRTALSTRWQVTIIASTPSLREQFKAPTLLIKSSYRVKQKHVTILYCGCFLCIIFVLRVLSSVLSCYSIREKNPLLPTITQHCTFTSAQCSTLIRNELTLIFSTHITFMCVRVLLITGNSAATILQSSNWATVKQSYSCECDSHLLV